MRSLLHQMTRRHHKAKATRSSARAKASSGLLTVLLVAAGAFGATWLLTSPPEPAAARSSGQVHAAQPSAAEPDAASSEALTGRASVIDGDTLEVAGRRIRLWGVDAPESRQTCTQAGAPWRCGQQAANALDAWLSARPVACLEIEKDQYGRSVSRCTAGGEDIGRWMVINGWAVEYTDYSDGRYAAAQRQAERTHAGIHDSVFTEPAQWRREQRTRSAPSPQTAPQEPPRSGCMIKGNISRKGERIYHLPGWSSYAATRIDTARGEQWFCSEAEAAAAGWRAARD